MTTGSIQRRGVILNPRARVLNGPLIYDTYDQPQMTGTAQDSPTDVAERDIVLYDHSHAPQADTSGNDYLAGGPDDDVIFGQLGR